jgi:hypothetical protein
MELLEELEDAPIENIKQAQVKGDVADVLLQINKVTDMIGNI